MFQLSNSLSVWGTPAFKQIFKHEVEALDWWLLPLQEGLSQGGTVSDSGFQVMILGTLDAAECIQVKAGIFYQGVIAGCNCADDPSVQDELTEYCEVLLDINKITAMTTVCLIDE